MLARVVSYFEFGRGSRVTGVAGVDSIGGYVKQYHVQADPVKLAAFGLAYGISAFAL